MASKVVLFPKAKPAPEAKKQIIDHYFGKLPTPAPSTYIRRWDTALTMGVLTGACTFAATSALSWIPLSPGVAAVEGGALFNSLATLKCTAWVLSGGNCYSNFFHEYWLGRFTDWALIGRHLAVAASSLYIAQSVFRKSLVPHNAIAYVSGSIHATGIAAIRAFRDYAIKLGLTKENAFMSLHPSAMWPAVQWKKHVLLVGGVGSGKTQLLLYWLKQIVDHNHKGFFYDVKGDLTSYFDSNTVALLTPWDERSHVWHIARDIRTPIQASAFAQNMIPIEEGAGKYWSTSAQMLLTGILRSLIADNPGKWGFGQLNSLLELAQKLFCDVLIKHYPKAANLIADDSQASSSVMSTLAAYTKPLEALAAAWPEPVKGRSIALTDWLRDDYKGPRQLITQGGEDSDLTSSVIAAMVDVCTTRILSPQLPNNEEGRHIFFVLDELSSLKPMRIPELTDKGRSKGVCCILSWQSESQMVMRYGEHIASAITGMVGTQITCRVMPGETRQAIIQRAGQNRVAVTHTNISGGFKDGVAASTSIQEELRDVLTPADLSSLGPIYEKGKYAGIKALVNVGGDYLELLYPPMILPEVRIGQVPAMWTLPGDKLGVPIKFKTSDKPTVVPKVVPPTVKSVAPSPRPLYVPAIQSVVDSVAQHLGSETMADMMSRLAESENTAQKIFRR